MLKYKKRIVILWRVSTVFWIAVLGVRLFRDISPVVYALAKTAGYNVVYFLSAICLLIFSLLLIAIQREEKQQ